MQCQQTIGRAIVFIENHLYEPIKAADVASAVSYSYYHFHRYFGAIMGENIGGYELAERDDFECYTERFLGPNNSQSEIAIYFPIK